MVMLLVSGLASKAVICVIEYMSGRRALLPIASWTAVASRVVIPIVFVAVAAVPVAGLVGAEPPPTQVITAVPVGPNGEPINGYRLAPSQSNVDNVADLHHAVSGCGSR
jgi:hypothetical protein